MTPADVLDRGTGGGGAGDDLRVNKRELARILGVSLPTMDALIDRYADLPIERRGSNGVEWQFDAAKVVAFIDGKKRAEAEQLQQRSEFLKQFTLPMDATAPEESLGAVSASQRKQIAEALRIERQLARESGLLVSTAEIRQKLAAPVAQFGRFLDNLPQQLGRRFNLPDEVVRAMRDMLDDQRRVFVRDLSAVLKQDDANAA